MTIVHNLAYQPPISGRDPCPGDYGCHGRGTVLAAYGNTVVRSACPYCSAPASAETQPQEGGQA